MAGGLSGGAIPLADQQRIEAQRQADLKKQRDQVKIGTDATKDVAGHAAGLGATAATQQAGFQTAAAAQSAKYATESARAKAGYDTDFATHQSTLLGQQRQAEAQLQAAAEARRMGAIPGLLGSLGGSQWSSKNTSGPDPGVPGQVQHGVMGGNLADESNANAAAYARAKDTAGQQGRAALNALADVNGARGLTGSGISVNQAGGVIGEGARQLGDVNREQLIQNLAANRAKASEVYQGNISQRGTDIAATTARRGQNIQLAGSLAPSLLGLVTARY